MPRRGYSRPGRLPSGVGRKGEILPDPRGFDGIKETIEDLVKRVEVIENSIQEAKKEASQVAAEVGSDEGSGKSGFYIRPMRVLYDARRAMYGYSMLLESMGLSKNQKQMINQVQNMINMIIRLQQTIQMADVTMKAFYASNPIGWAMLAFSTGTMIGSMMYGARGIGG